MHKDGRVRDYIRKNDDADYTWGQKAGASRDHWEVLGATKYQSFRDRGNFWDTLGAPRRPRGSVVIAVRGF